MMHRVRPRLNNTEWHLNSLILEKSTSVVVRIHNEMLRSFCGVLSSGVAALLPGDKPDGKHVVWRNGTADLNVEDLMSGEEQAPTSPSMEMASIVHGEDQTVLGQHYRAASSLMYLRQEEAKALRRRGRPPGRTKRNTLEQQQSTGIVDWRSLSTEELLRRAEQVPQGEKSFNLITTLVGSTTDLSTLFRKLEGSSKSSNDEMLKSLCSLHLLIMFSSSSSNHDLLCRFKSL